MDWARDGAEWPHREASRFVDCRPHRWHVQVMGQGPVLLLLHGAGGATQSWRRLMPLLAENWTVVAPDMPGQGFTRMGSRWRSGLDPTAEDIAALLAQEGWIPAGLIGHSAGAAVALRLAEILPEPPRGVVGINAALGSFKGLAGFLFPMMAKIMALNPLTPVMVSRFSGGEGRVAELLATTGSAVDAEGLGLYARLVRDRDHVDGTLTMMAQWKLDGLIARMSRIDTPALLLVGERDGTVPAEVSREAAARLPAAEVVSLGPLGHLAHEEAPETVMNAMAGFLSDTVKPDVPAGT
jgi:magnesium chelatase accessory protein